MNQNDKQHMQENKKQSNTHFKSDDTIQSGKDRMSTDGNTHTKSDLKPEFQNSPKRNNSSSDQAKRR